MIHIYVQKQQLNDECDRFLGCIRDITPSLGFLQDPLIDQVILINGNPTPGNEDEFGELKDFIDERNDKLLEDIAEKFSSV